MPARPQVIKPNEYIMAQIRYTPSNLDITEQGEVQFVSQEIGKWRYLVFGVGVPPTKFEPRVVSIGLNKDFSSTIHFKNPFKETINVTITLEADKDNQEVFKLLTKMKKEDQGKAKVSVPGMNILQIPFSFVPREINCYYCEIVVSMNEKIQWRYPIKGVTESVYSQVLHSYKAQCREKVEHDLKVYLPGVTARAARPLASAHASPLASARVPARFGTRARISAWPPDSSFALFCNFHPS